MANICTNIFYCSTDNAENLRKIQQFLEDTFSMEYYSSDDHSIEGEFDSRWSFPESDFEALLSILDADATLYVRVLSHELCDEYASLRIYKNNEWSINF